MSTIGDIWKPYAKPSMKGRLIIRKRTVNRKSQNVIAINNMIKGSPVKPATLAKFICFRRVHGRAPSAQELATFNCPWEIFVSLLQPATAFVLMQRGKQLSGATLDIVRAYEAELREAWNALGGGAQGS